MVAIAKAVKGAFATMVQLDATSVMSANRGVFLAYAAYLLPLLEWIK